MSVLQFEAGRLARDAHASLQAALSTMDRARHCAVLWFADIQRRKLYRELGYASMRQNALSALGFSPNHCAMFLRLARRLDELPALRASLADRERIKCDAMISEPSRRNRSVIPPARRREVLLT